VDSRLAAFYDRLLAVLRQCVVREGEWQLVECTPAWDGNWTVDCFVIFAWQGAPNGNDERVLVTVNYAPNQSQCHARLPFAGLDGHTWRLHDQLSDAVYDRDGADLLAHGLYLDEGPWQARVYKLTRLG